MASILKHIAEIGTSLGGAAMFKHELRFYTYFCAEKLMTFIHEGKFEQVARESIDLLANWLFCLWDAHQVVWRGVESIRVELN